MQLKKLLKNSVFYPASGIDGSAIRNLSSIFPHFVYADYSIPLEAVENAMSHNFYSVGYDLCDQKRITYHQLISPIHRGRIRNSLNAYESERILQAAEVRLNYQNFTPFAIWSRYALNKQRARDATKKAAYFELLHVGGEACEVFDGLYLSAGINPSAMVFINPAEGYGDNWTCFTQPGFRLHQSVMLNAKSNGACMPEKILSNVIVSTDDNTIWNQYYLNRGFNFYDDELRGVGVYERGVVWSSE